MTMILTIGLLLVTTLLGVAIGCVILEGTMRALARSLQEDDAKYMPAIAIVPPRSVRRWSPRNSARVN